MDLAQDIQNNKTLFGKILRGEIPANVAYEDDLVYAFHDISPKAKVHILIIPKQHFTSLQDVAQQDAATLGHLMVKIHEVAEKFEISESGYRVISNAGVDSGQEVPHLHFHILGGEKLPKF